MQISFEGESPTLVSSLFYIFWYETPASLNVFSVLGQRYVEIKMSEY